MSVAQKLYHYQTQAVDFACSRPGVALFMEQGVGKTYVTGGIIERLLCGHGKSALLVVPLANLVTTWVRMLREIDWLQVSRTWEDFKKAGKQGVLLINYERVRPIIKRLKTVEWTLAVYDESQRLKARGSKQSKDAARLSATHRVLLSGTPIEQAPQDLWGQFRFAVPDVLGRKWSSFEDRWIMRTGFMGYERKFRDELLPKFLKLIDPHILRVRKADVLDLPKLTYVRVPVPLLGEQERIYQEITREMIATVGDELVTCDMAVTQLVRQQQVCGGFVRLDPTEAERAEAAESGKLPKGRMVVVGRAKQRRLRAIVRRETRRPIIVFCGYREEIPAIVEVMESEGLSYGIVSGKTKKTRTDTVERFQRGELDALVCQIKAGGVGLDLQVASVAIVYSTTWSWIDFDQAVSRIHRHGQANPVTVYLTFAQNTVDEKIYSALLTKRSVTELILNRRKLMAKDKMKAEKTKTSDGEKKKPTPPPQPPKPKYGVPELAEAMGIKASSVRVRLRSAGVEKSGKLYGWDSKSEMAEVITKLKASGRKKGGDDDAEEDDGE